MTRLPSAQEAAAAGGPWSPPRRDGASGSRPAPGRAGLGRERGCHLGLADLIRPVPPASFISDDWQRNARHYPSSLGDRTADLLDLPAFELLLGTLNRAHEGWLHLVRDGSRPVPTEMVDTEGMLRLGPVRAAFRQGHTLYLTKAHRVCAPLMRLARAVEIEVRDHGVRLRAPISAHVFLTPPESRGFLPHRDEHASLVLQLEGSKEWDVYADARDADEPRHPGLVGDDALQGQRTTFSLSAGDALYVPEYWVHSARTGGSHSLHVTLRLFPLRWLDVLEGVLPDLAALDHPVPPGSGTREVVRGLCRALDGDPVRTRLPGAVHTLLERIGVPESVLPDDGLGSVVAAPRIDSTTSLVKAAGMTCIVSRHGDEVQFAFPGGSISAPGELEAVFRHVAAARQLRPTDLPAGTAEYDRVGLLRELVLAGILRLESPPTSIRLPEP